MLFLENDDLKVGFFSMGGELRSVVNKHNGYEYMWDANPEYWGRISPVLFPIVGKLKNGQYTHNGKTYALPQHGYLRDQEMVVVEHTSNKIVFQFESKGNFLDVYPFEHEVTITYTLDKDTLEVAWAVKNLSQETMIYGIGAHPAIRLEDDKAYTLDVLGGENTNSFDLQEGLIGDSKPAPGDHSYTITNAMFENDTIIYDNAHKVILKETQGAMGVECEFEGFPFIALWTNIKDRKTPPYICIEPWCGIADFVDTDGVLAHKRGMNHLAEKESKTHIYTLRFV